MTTKKCPKTLAEAVRFFSDMSVCHSLMRKAKWPGGNPDCPKCSGKSVHELASHPGLLKCNSRACQKQFSLKVGTIFESSPLGLDKWFIALWSMINCNGISSFELSRVLEVRQATAWFMTKRIRIAIGENKEKDFEKALKRIIRVPKNRLNNE